MPASRNYPVFMAGAIVAVLLALVGTAAVQGSLPSAKRTQAESKPAESNPAESNPAAKLAEAKQADQPAPAAAKAPQCAKCGVIESVRKIEVKGETSGVGAVAGGVAGAVVGNQFGHGDGRTVMTIAGAAGGAYAGNEIERHAKKRTVYRVTVRMEDGRRVTLSQATAPAFPVGARVRVNGKALERA